METNSNPTAYFGNAISTGTLSYNHTREPVTPTPKWNSYVSQNYHAAKNTSGLNHNQTMRSLGSNYKDKKSTH